MRTALLVVDVQTANFDGKTMPPIHDGERLLANVGKLIQKARAAGAPVVYIQHTDSDAERGTPGWQIHPAVAPKPGESVVEKRTPDSFHETLLQAVLQSKGVTGLVVAGLQSEYCIDTTVRRAFSLGYDVTLVSDAHSTWDGGDLTAAQIIAHHNQVLGGWFAKLRITEGIGF
ncbi:MAG: cysteine hydrolase [Anaerolineae bacterium]|nr:cysteine hydrolase [Anaerolineae bacterium]